MDVKKGVVLLTHSIVVPFIAFHVASKLIWPLVGPRVLIFSIPILLINLFKGNFKRIYAISLIYAYLTLPLYYLTWVWGVVKYDFDPNVALSVPLILIGFVNFLFDRSLKSLSLLSCILSGSWLSANFSFPALWLHYACVVTFLVILFYKDYHTLLFPVNFALKAHRRANGVV